MVDPFDMKYIRAEKGNCKIVQMPESVGDEDFDFTLNTAYRTYSMVLAKGMSPDELVWHMDRGTLHRLEGYIRNQGLTIYAGEPNTYKLFGADIRVHDNCEEHFYLGIKWYC